MPQVTAFLALIGSASVLSAQDTTTSASGPSIEEFLQQDSVVSSTTAVAAGSPIFPEVWCSDISDEPTRERCWQAYQASLSYYETGLSQRTRVFAWQHLSTRIIFFVVLVLVFVGLYFAWLQFRLGLSSPSVSESPEHEAATGIGAQHQIEVSLKGVKVSSPVLGVLILTLSLAFFYLYLVYVYPISEIF